MALLIIDPAQVAAVRIIDAENYPLAEAVPVGGYGRVGATGLVLGNATTTGELGNRRGVVFEISGKAARVMHKGILDLGDALDGLDLDDLVYVGDTDARLADAAGTVTLIAGVVVPGYGELTASKLLEVDL
jgi:hypothetical protein